MTQILERPMQEQNGDVTELLRKWRAGDRAAEEQLFEVVFPVLRRRARALLSKERRGQPLASAELVINVYTALVRAKDRDWQDRAHFFAIAARAMRWHLIDMARKIKDRQFLPLDGLDSVLRDRCVNLDQAMEIDNLLDELAATHPDWCVLVEMKCFLGLSDQEAADALNLPLRSVQRMWHDAREWLFERAKQTRAAKVHSVGR
jgi:RNA polymerase sigma factor (TIGR02999 family)